MTKKIILCAVLFTAFIFSFNYVFAENMAQDAANTVNGSIDKTQNVMNNAGNAVKDVGNGMANTVNDAINGTKNAVNNLTQDRDNTNYDNSMNMSNRNDNSNYTATRTANEGTVLGMNSTTWTWIIMGLVGIAIASLIWYYAEQTSNNHDYDE